MASGEKEHAFHRENAVYLMRQLPSAAYIRSKRFALPLRILTLSSSHNGTDCIHLVAGSLATNGQSTANMMRSTPISCTQHMSAGSEKLPLVVMWKLPQNTSRKLIDFCPGRDSAASMRQSGNGHISPRCPMMILSPG